MEKKAIIERLENLLEEVRQQYTENGRQDFDAGRADGVKMALYEISKMGGPV